MKIFWNHLLLYILIILFNRNATGKLFSYEDIVTQDVDFLQYHKKLENNGTTDYRLPTSIKPISYEIILIPKLQDNFTFEGSIKINAVVKNETNRITLHVGNIQIVTQSVSVDNKNVNIYINHTYDNITEKYTLIVSEILKKESKILISFGYNGILNDNMIGFYKSSYFDKNGQIKWLAATQFQATHARHAFPCFDEPSFKAKFIIRISRNKNYTCLSNMPLNNSLTTNKGYIWDTFQESVPMSTYLVAFVISEFSSFGSNKFKIWSRPSVINQTSYALKIGTTALELLGNKFQQMYHLPKIDMVAIPDFAAGAMENWGLVTYREPRILYDEKESSASAQQSVASVIVHELTHMWFGNLVTPEWWSYLWLSEAFARYFQYFGTAEIEILWNMKEQFVVEQHESALIADGFESSHPMTREVFSQSQIGGMGDSITYAKGASIVRMMNLMFGNNVFESALRSYLHNNKEKGLGHPDALWKAIQKLNLHSQQLLTQFDDVKTIMDTWTKQAGYPVVSIDINDKGFYITQQRFFLRNLNKSSTNVTWWIPLTWTTQTKPIFNDTLVKHWLSTENDTINFKINSKEWVIFNIQSSGFYRVNYNQDGWQRIINVLNSEKFNEIHVLNRAGIVDDLLNLGRAGFQNYETVLNGITYLKRETNYLPFKAAFNGLDYLNKRFSGYNEYSLFKEYVLSLIHDKRKILGYEDNTNDDRLTILLRREANNWACNLGDDECITVYMNKFEKWRANTSISIKTNERTITYCVAARYGTFEDWEFLWKQYLNSNYVTDQTVIITALGCSLNTTILEKYLGYAVSSYATNRIRKQDSTNVFAAVYNSGLIGAEYILDFVEKHYKEMEKYYGSQSTIATILDGASQHFSTPYLVEKFQNFTNRHKTKFAPILESLESSLRIAKYELEWYKSASVPIIQWLERKKYRLPTNISPRKYVISVTPYLEMGNFTVDGHVKIEAEVVQQTRQIVLHSAEIKHHTVTVTANQTKVKIVNQNIEKKYDFYVIYLDQELTAGTKLIIEIEYTSHLNSTELRGFYKSSYIDNNGKTRWLAATHLEPVGARKMFPCFDEPAMKALFTLKVSVPLGYEAVSNMEWQSIIKINDRLLYTFLESVKMSTYLVAVVISDFEIKYATNKTKYAILARPNAINQTEYAASLISPIVNFFETMMKQQYKISKLYMVALPDFPSGAGENWGLITYREPYLLYDENHSPITSKQNIRNVIAHEISHQWFGNLVSPLWWKYLWLNEGFARYFEYHVPARVFNDTTLELQFVVDQVHSAFKADSSNSTHALNYDVSSPSEIRSIFDSITYAKGASILRMIEKSYGSEIFYEALRGYLSKRKYDVATSEHLYAAFQEEITKKKLKDKLKSILDTWITQPGYPFVYVNITNNTIILRQERFFFKQLKDINKDNSIWHIPITWASINNYLEYSNTTPKLWLSENKMEIKNLSVPLLTFNVQQSGYYRVNYDTKYWIKLFDYLKNNNISTIHKINRAALIDDLMNFARADYIDYKTVISALIYLKRENNYLPWRAFYNNLPYLNNRFRGRSIENIYNAYLRSLLEPLYTQLGFEDRKNDDDLTIMLRMHTRKWACKLDIGNCKFYAAKYFQQKRYLKIIPPNYRDVVYCTAMSTDMTNYTYNFLWKEYLNSTVTTDKLVILSSLACSQNKNILEKLLRDAVAENSYIRYQDSAKVFSDVYDASLIGIEAVINVIKNNYNNILRKHFNDYTKIENIVNSLASRLSTHYLYEQYQNLLKWLVNKELAFEKSVYSYLSTAQYEFDWYEKNAPIIFEELDEQFLSNTYRLPNTLYPELYNVTLKPNMEKGIFEGKVQIYIKVKNDTTSIILNSHNLNISNIKVFKNYMPDNHVNAKLIPLLNYKNMQLFQQLRIYLKSEVKNAENIMTEINFNGILNDDMQGFYRSSYLYNNKQHWLATTQFEPTHARKAFPCFDEPAFKSQFIININRPNHYNTLSNMPKSKELKNDNYTLDIFNVSKVKMPTYLVAFVISEFEPVNKSEKFLNVWGRPEVVEHGKYAQDIAKALINELQNFTNIKYPLPKLDLVGIPDFSMGAMENWGLATFREYGLFYNKTETTATYEKYIITVIAHELAHMWFGNLVTCAWWDYIWLNEGFAQFFEWFVADQILPDYKFMDQFVVYELQSALLQDSLPSAHPMTNPVELPEEINNIFDYVTYGKSASILRMLFNILNKVKNPETLKLVLRHYLNKFKGGTVRPTDLWESFEQIVSLNKTSFEEIMNTWTNQPGYPVVNATLINNYNVKLTQERFLINRSANNEFYWIPIDIISSENSNYIIINSKVWLGSEPKNIFINSINDWFIVNYKQTGFYRVNYDIYSWKRLINQLNSKEFESIHVLNRAQIIDDLFNLARATYVNYELVLNASKYLIQETNHLPWKAFFNGLSYIYERFEEKSDYENLKNYVLKIISKIYNNTGFKDLDNDKLLDRLNREMILQWACKLNNTDCVKKSIDLFKNWTNNLEGSNNRIPCNARSAVYCTAIKKGTANDWKILWKQYLKTNFGSEKKIIINALGCSTNKTMLQNYLGKAIEKYNSANATIRRQDVSAVFTSVYSTSQLGVDVTLDFLIINTSQVFAYFGNWDDVATLFHNVASHISNWNQYDKLKKFESNITLHAPDIKVRLASAVTTAKANLIWYEKNNQIITQWIKNELFEPSTDPNSSTIRSMNIIFMTFVVLIPYFLNYYY